MNKKYKPTDFQEYLAKELKSPTFKKQYENQKKRLEVAYKILLLREQKKMSQKELAKKIGTKQSNIARMEAGDQNFTADTLQKIASAFGRNLKIEFVK